MHQQLEVLEILNRLRKTNESKIPLSDLLNARYGGIIPGLTAGGEFGAGICKLVDFGFIKLYDGQGNDITDKIQSIGNTSGVYEVAKFFMGQERYVCASLTKKLGEMQLLLGISVTRALEDFDQNWMRVQPIFGKPKGAKRADVFVLMPLHEDFSPIYHDHIHKVCETLKLMCRRADDIFGANNIIDDVWELIANSKIIIADCTNRNPNVFYELGIAHTLGKRVIITTQSEKDIPFDISHIRFIKYDYTPRGMEGFETNLEKFILEERDKIASPVTHIDSLN
jgi:hypothetical protein